MTASFTKNKQTGKFDIITLEGVEPGDSVQVRKADGSTTIVMVDRVSRAFVAKFGALKGQKAVICTIAAGRKSGGTTGKRKAPLRGTHTHEHCGCGNWSGYGSPCLYSYADAKAEGEARYINWA